MGIYVDGSSISEVSRVGIVIASPEGIIFEHALRLEFPATNNKVKYEAIITRFEVAKGLELLDLRVYIDSQVVIGNIKGDCVA